MEENRSRLTIAEAAEIYGVRPRTIWRAVADGRIPGDRQGRLWYIKPVDMAVAVYRRRVRTTEAAIDLAIDVIQQAPPEALPWGQARSPEPADGG